ncbi:MAG TPA: S9 family peptidase [Acidimicrobiales bacterium]
MKRPIPYEEIARLPQPGTAVPRQLGFGPEDRVLTYLHSPELGLNQRLYALDLTRDNSEPVEVRFDGVASSEEDLPLEERLRRERAREVSLGVTSATWAEEGDVLMVPLPAGVFVLRGLAAAAVTGATDVGAVERLLVVRAGDGGPVEDPQLSPDGLKLAFVRDGDIYVADATAAEAPLVRLTNTATDGVFNGLAEFIAQEEMRRDHGLWWSPDSSLIAYAQVDERHIPIYRIAHQGSDGPNGGTFEDHRYPFAGADNARLHLGVVPVAGGATVWMSLGESGADLGDAYLARVAWFPDGSLAVQVEARDQKTMDVQRLDVATGESTTLHIEKVEPWINLHNDFKPLKMSDPLGCYLWSSERSGYRHLEVRGPDGSLITQLTSGEWAVDELGAVDEERGLVYFTGAMDDSTEKHLYCVPLEGGISRRLTAEPGVHDVVLSRRMSLFIDSFSSLDRPPVVVLKALPEANLARPIYTDADPRVAELDLDPPVIARIPGADGTELNAMTFRAQGAEVDIGPPPLVVYVYGGPEGQLVQNSWRSTVMLRAQALTRLGCTVLVVDNRGTSRRGLKFEAPIHLLAGHVELDDQVAGVRWAVEQGIADPDRVGIYGWSYGGYMSLMALARAPDVFKAAVAGAPVTHHDGYDTHYTEHYMGTPGANPDGYERSSVLAHTHNIRGKLMLVHGGIDENVHFRHTARLINRLIEHRVPYALLLFPKERHLPRRTEDRAYMEETVVNWLVEALS